MDNNEIKNLIVAFKEYRDLLTPIEQNLKEFSLSFDSISSDIKNLNSSFDGNVQQKLDLIVKDLSQQVEKAKNLSGQVDSFMASTNRYVSSVDKLINICGRIEERLNAVDKLENDAEVQIAKLDAIIEEKKKTYNIKQLEKNLETYNIGVQKVSEFINKDVAEVIKNSGEKIQAIQDKNNNIYQSIMDEKSSIDELIDRYSTNNELLRKIVERNDVNEQYIYDILDKWADTRKIKTKEVKKKKEKKKK